MHSYPKTPSLVAALMACAAWPAGAAWADVTPEEVWQNWQDTSAAMGQTVVAGSVAREGDTLKIGAVTMASAANGITAEGSIAQILMADQGDGTVLVTMSPDYPLKMRLPPTEAGAPEVELNILVTQDDLRMIASGTADAISYDLTAPAIKIKLDRIAGSAAQEANLTVDATLSALSGTYATRKTDAGMQADSDIAAKGLALAVLGADPAQQSEFRGTAAIAGLALKSSGALAGAALAAGTDPNGLAALETLSEMTSQSTEFTLEFAGPSGTTMANGTLGLGQISAKTKGGAMDFAASQTDAALTVTTPSVPVPDMAVALDRFALAFTTPIAPSAVALPFAFSTELANLTLSDTIWALLDPSAALPRDPIHLLLDSSGTTKVNAPPADPNAAPLLPAELDSLALNSLRIEGLGAALTAQGSSTFTPDPSGIPSPNAKVDVTFLGANGLLEKLATSGLVGPEMLTFAGFLLAMAASPMADGSDGYTSTIEIQDKAVSANGQVLYQLP